MEEIFVIDGDTFETVEEQMKKALNEMYQIIGTHNLDLVSFAGDGSSGTPLPNGKCDNEFGGFALVINGHSLVSGVKSCQIISWAVFEKVVYAFEKKVFLLGLKTK